MTAGCVRQRPSDKQLSVRPAASPLDSDWRFLLPIAPPYDHLLLLGGPAGLSDQLLASGTAHSVSSMPHSQGSHDVVVRLHDAPETLEQVAASVEHASVVYWEVRKGRFTASFGRRSIGRRLEDMGLRVTATYWIRPGLGAPRWHIPLEIPGAVSWVLGSFFVPTTAIGTVARWTSGIAYLLPGSVMRPFIGRTAVVALRGSHEQYEGPEGPFLLDQEEMPPALRNSALSAILFAPGENNRLALFPMQPKARRPDLVVKLWRSAVGNYRVEWEQRILASLHGSIGQPLSNTIPRPLGTFLTDQGIVVGIESRAPGRPLVSILAGRGITWRRKVSSLDRVTDWLTTFHSATEVERPRWGDAEPRRWVTEALRAYTSAFAGLTPVEAELFERTGRQLELLSDCSIPIVMNHWGLAASNVFYGRRGGLTVIDWEGGSYGAPLLDLLFWIADWSRLVMPDEPDLSRFRRAFLHVPGDRISAVADRATGRYIDALRIDGRSVPVALVILLTTRALWQPDAGKEGSSRRTGNVYASYLDALGRDSAGLFAG